MNKINRVASNWHTIKIVIYIFLFFIFITTSDIDCIEYKNGCTKTVCSFWGCSRIEVDIESSQCEHKEKICIDRGLVIFGYKIK